MAIAIQIQLNDNLWIRDPQKTDLGRRIIEHSIILIDELGFEKFTFRKLADAIGSTEASVYRYFENKHKLLIYLVSWYWEWVRYQIEFNSMNIDDAEARLAIAIDTIVDSSKSNPAVEFVDESLLQSIVIAEATKAYHTKNVDLENEDGLFYTYKALCKQIAGIILELNPDYPYPRALASNLLETANDQTFFVRHLPSLSDIKKEDLDEDMTEIKKLLKHFAFNLVVGRPATAVS